MTWKTKINAETAVWHGVEEYAAERREELVAVCAAVESSDLQIRQAQAAILELDRLVALPTALRAEAQIRAQTGARKEY